MTTGYEHISDEALPVLPVLLGGEATDVLAAAVEPQGGSIRSLRMSQIRYTPASAIVVRYQADIRWADGSSTRESLVASSGGTPPEGALVLSSGDDHIAVWAYPNDPYLPGLAVAADPDRVAELLESLGVARTGASLRLRAYRPGRRAVMEVVSKQARIYLKIVRPSRVADLQSKHTALSGSVPVPHSHGWNEQLGLVALQAMPGKPLRKALESGTRNLPDPGAFSGLLEAFPSSDGPVVKGPDLRAAFHATVLGIVAPELKERVARLVESVANPVSDEPVPVHGDFHSSQILVRGNEIIGLIDVDTAGTGNRIDDYAVLLAHIATAGLTTSARRHFDRYGARLIGAFDHLEDPKPLRRKVAGAIVGFATGPFRVNLPQWRAQTERRIALAERWAESAASI